MPPSGGRKGNAASGVRGAVTRSTTDGQQRGKVAAGKVDNSGKQRAIPDAAAQDTNVGFGKYLKSDEGIEMMKLFVIANTIVVFMTMAWPQMQQSYQILRTMIFGDEADEYGM